MPYCSLLNNHVCVKLPGIYAPCCIWNKDYTRFADNPTKYFTTTNKSFNEYYNSELHQEVIDYMNIKKKWHPGCKKCKDLEEQGFKSGRQKAAEISVKDKIAYMQISLSNYCNFACKTCDTKSSTGIKKLVNNNPSLAKWFFDNDQTKAIDYHKIFDDLDLSNLEFIELIGGEPFVDPQIENFLDFLLSKEILSNVKLKVHTNSSFYPKKIISKLSKLKELDLNLSIDAWHPSIEYNRLGSDFNKIKNIVHKWIDFSKKYQNTKINFFVTIGALNIEFLEPTIQAANNLGLGYDYVILTSPKHLSFNALPEKYVNLIENDYNKEFLKNYMFDNEQFQLLKKFIKDTDGTYNKYLKDYIPNLAKYIEGE